MPTTCPVVFSSALPEVPAAIGAVVVMSPVSVTAPADIVPVVPLTIPWLAVPEGGSWLPTATTTSPTWTVPESANVAAASPVAPLTRMTPTPLAGSEPLTVPAYRWPAAVVIRDRLRTSNQAGGRDDGAGRVEEQTRPGRGGSL